MFCKASERWVTTAAYVRAAVAEKMERDGLGMHACIACAILIK